MFTVYRLMGFTNNLALDTPADEYSMFLFESHSPKNFPGVDCIHISTNRTTLSISYCREILITYPASTPCAARDLISTFVECISLVTRSLSLNKATSYSQLK